MRITNVGRSEREADRETCCRLKRHTQDRKFDMTAETFKLQNTAGHVGFPPRTFEGQSSCKEWKGKRIEIRESTQYSSQGARTFALWLV